MMKKLATLGYRVAPMYNDEPNGTIVEIVDELHVMVEWDNLEYSNPFQFGNTLQKDTRNIQKEQIKYLRKGK